jgi:hypothetical protein
MYEMLIEQEYNTHAFLPFYDIYIFSKDDYFNAVQTVKRRG